MTTTTAADHGTLQFPFDDVLAAAKAGGAWALRSLYEELSPAVCGYAKGQGASDPEGIVNETFLRAFRRIGSFEGTAGRFRSWVFTIARNLVIDERRRLGRRFVETSPGHQDAEHPVASSAEETVLEAVGQDAVVALLRALPPDQCDVLLLRLVADLTVSEIAESVGRSVGAVKALQRRGLKRLRLLVEGGGLEL